nr:LOG family protein [Arenimonas sp.]
ALPGGCGTMEELFEAITLKQLGLYFNPILLLNTRNYYQLLMDLMQQAIDQRFMNHGHDAMWSMVDSVPEILPKILATPKWRQDARDFAVVR